MSPNLEKLLNQAKGETAKQKRIMELNPNHEIIAKMRGRADDVINTGGYKVVPGEVAAALQSCPGVREVAVVGQPDPQWGERVVAVVVPADPGAPPAPELLRRHVRERLPRYAIPSRVVMVDAVPMLPSGKQDIVRLRQELLRREQTEAESVIY